MKILRTSAASVLVGAAVLLLAPQPAHAALSRCSAGIETQNNYAYASCGEGSGTYRVTSKCNSAHWPYTRTIVGPWVTKTAGVPGPRSVANGDPQGCHVVGPAQVEK